MELTGLELGRPMITCMTIRFSGETLQMDAEILPTTMKLTFTGAAESSARD